MMDDGWPGVAVHVLVHTCVRRSWRKFEASPLVLSDSPAAPARHSPALTFKEREHLRAMKLSVWVVYTA